MTTETKEKIRATQKKKYASGEIKKYWLGKKRSDEDRKKMGMRNCDKEELSKKSRERANNVYNRVDGLDIKKRISIGVKKAYEEGRLVPNVIFFNTKPELAIKKILEENNIEYEQQFKIAKKIYDFYLPDYNLIIEVDGVYWHGKNIKDEDLKYSNLIKNRKNDHYKNQLAKDKGYNLIRIWEDEIDKFENLIKNDFLGLEYMEVLCQTF